MNRTAKPAPDPLLALAILSVAFFLVSCAGGGRGSSGGGTGGNTGPTNNPVPVISSISPSTTAAAGPGFSLTVDGANFVSTTVVNWNGAPLVTTFGSSTNLTAAVPAANIATSGAAQIIAVNPSPGGGSSAPITFTITAAISQGTLLPGAPDALAKDATTDVPGVAVDSSLIQDGVILNQLEVVFADNATVAQVNAALAPIAGGIVSMSHGFTFVTVGVAPQSTIAALQQLAQTIAASPGVVAAFPASVSITDVLPTDPASFSDAHLLPTRFPAAWNAMNLALQTCNSRKIAVLVPDDFLRPAPPSHNGFALEVPNFTLLSAGENGNETHGYDTTTTLGALFNGASPTGANPFSECLNITGVQVANMGIRAMIDRIVTDFPAGAPFILNFSLGFQDQCRVEIGPNNERRCKATSVKQRVANAYTRAWFGLYWKQRTHNRWEDFFAAASAGNSRGPADTDPDYLVADAYPGVGVARYNSPLAVATVPDSFFNFITDRSLWAPDEQPTFPDLTAGVDQQAALSLQVTASGFAEIAGAPNILVVGSTTPGLTFGALEESSFSNTGPDVSAVGENVNTFAGSENGTSFSAPQIAGLASYLWLLSDDLHIGRPMSATRDALVSNVRNLPAAGPGPADPATPPHAIPVLDAYATVLSLDAAAIPNPQSAPVRLAILDVNNDGKFDENDLSLFLSHFQDSFGNPFQPSLPDYSRFDLNGDGYTGGDRTEAFDLDRISSKQYGVTVYSSDVQQMIEGKTIHFNSNAVNDTEILCYYAYSPMYTGDAALRQKLVGGCGGITVEIDPAGATMAPGSSKLFGATVRGTPDPRVTWSATDGGGTIDQLGGVYKAGIVAGTYKIRATSVVDTNAFAEATITITSNCTFNSNSDFLHYFIGNRGAVPNPIASDFLSNIPEISNNASGPETSDSVDVSYGVLSGSASDTNTANSQAGSPAFSSGEFSDEVSITPVDPRLQDMPIVITKTMKVTGSGGISGDTAEAGWTLEFGGAQGSFATLSTVPGDVFGDISGGTFTSTVNTNFGEATIDATLLVSVGLTSCGSPGRPTCPPPGTGAGHVQATARWLGMTIKDLSGNVIPSVVCSYSGTNWLNPQ